jgi:hypothetical protein
LFAIAVSGVIDTTYSSILIEQAVTKQVEQRQSTPSKRRKIASKSLYYKALPSKRVPQLKAFVQVEQFLFFELIIFQR